MKWSIPEKVIEIGRDYARQGRVLSWNENKARRLWHAEVMDEELFYVELDGTAKEEDVCQCIYWQQHGYCAHTVAVELAMRNKSVSRFIPDAPAPVASTSTESVESDLSTTLFTKSFERLQETQFRKMVRDTDALLIQYYLEIVSTSEHHADQGVVCIYLKIAHKETPNKYYMLKNIDEFLECYVDEKELRLGSLNWKIGPESFDLQDRKRIERLEYIKQNQTIFEKSRLTSKKTLDRRYLVLSKEQADAWLNDLNETSECKVQVEGCILSNPVVQKGDLPLTCSLKPVGLTGYELFIDDPSLAYISSYNWMITSEGIYELSDEQHRVYQVLRQMLKRTEGSTWHYNETQLSALFSSVIPQLQTLTSFELPDSLESEVLRYPLEPYFYMSRVQSTLQIELDFCYGPYIFSKNQNRQTIQGDEGRVLRDTVQENRLEDLLRHYGYGFNEQGYEKALPKQETLYRLFTKEIPTFEKYGTVSLSDDISNLYLDTPDHVPKMTVQTHQSWFDVSFDISAIEDSEVNDVLVSLIQKKPYHQLKNGQLLLLEHEAYHKTSAILQKFREDIRFEDHRIQLPMYRGLMFDDNLTQLGYEHDSQSFNHMVQHLKEPEAFEAHVPKGLVGELRDYQHKGFKWFKVLSHYQFGGILADDMGLGKTIQTIAYILSEKEEGALQQPALIVAPTSLIYNWMSEFERFAPSLNVHLILGNKNQRIQQLEETSQADVLIVSYATLRQDQDIFQNKGYHALILDEAQMVKNTKTKIFKAISGLNVPRTFALSGTPIENRLEELWAIFSVLMPGFFPPLKTFKLMQHSEIAAMIQPFVLRRIKKDVLEELPDLIETDRYTPLVKEQKTVYLAYLKQIQETLSKISPEEFNKQRFSILSGLTRLRQICCHPALFLEDYKGGSGKLDEALELIEQANRSGRRILLFSQFTGMLDILEDELSNRSLETFYLRGSTPTKDRQEMVDRFNRGEKDVFLISLKAGGTGLNLTGADTVILYDLWWNPAVEEQAMGRAHRMGQTKKVEVWRLVTEGTIEQKILELQSEKKALFENILHSKEVSKLSEMTLEDVQHILTLGETDETM